MIGRFDITAGALIELVFADLKEEFVRDKIDATLSAGILFPLF